MYQTGRKSFIIDDFEHFREIGKDEVKALLTDHEFPIAIENLIPVAISIAHFIGKDMTML